MTKTVKKRKYSGQEGVKTLETPNDGRETHARPFKIGAESYAQRQNKAPGRKYVVSWMTKTVKKRKYTGQGDAKAP